MRILTKLAACAALAVVTALSSLGSSVTSNTETCSLDTRKVKVYPGPQELGLTYSGTGWGARGGGISARIESSKDGDSSIIASDLSGRGVQPWTPKGPGRYELKHSSGFAVENAIVVITRERELEEAFKPNASVETYLDSFGNPTNYTVTVTNDITGPVEIPKDITPITIDLNGKNIIGDAGDGGSMVSEGGDGSPAIVISGETAVTVVDTTGDPKGSISGGNGGDGNPPGKGAVPIIAKSDDGTDSPAPYDNPMDLTIKSGEGGKSLKSDEQQAIEKAFEPNDVIVTPVVDDNGATNYTVKINEDITGPIEIPDNVGGLDIDLNDHTIIGTNGVDGTTTTPGTDGLPAIIIVPGEWKDGDKPTVLSIDTNEGREPADVAGGKGGDGNPPGDGAPAIQVATNANADVVINIGPDVDVVGGNGGDGLGVDEDGNGVPGGEGGAGVEGDVGTNDGAITGGEGGDGSSSETGNGGAGGEGGAGVEGDVGDNTETGTITGGEGGDGGDSKSGEGGAGGAGGQGVSDEVANNDGDITGGNGGDGGDGGDSETGAGGDGGDGGDAIGGDGDPEGEGEEHGGHGGSGGSGEPGGASGRTGDPDSYEDVFPSPEWEVSTDTNGVVTARLTEDLMGPVEIPDNMGDLIIDLDGHTIIGTNGVNGTEKAPGTDGLPAIIIVPGDWREDDEPTDLTIVTADDGGKSADVVGGNGGDGNPPGDGAPAIQVATNANDKVVINIGPDVDVVGGKGGNGLGVDEDGNGIPGGEGGAGVEGDVGTNEGTITGGDGGNGSSSETGEGGAGGEGGQGVSGDVANNDGDITGGNGGDGGDSKTGAGGDGGDGGDAIGGDGNPAGEGEEHGGHGGSGGSGDPDGKHGEAGEPKGLADVFPEPEWEVRDPDENGDRKVILREDITGPVIIPDDLGTIIVDMAGHTITGADGTNGTVAVNGGDGSPAILIVPGNGGNDDTRLLCTDSTNTSAHVALKGGNGGDGRKGGNGAPAIQIADGAKVSLGDVFSSGTISSEDGVDGKSMFLTDEEIKVAIDFPTTPEGIGEGLTFSTTNDVSVTNYPWVVTTDRYAVAPSSMMSGNAGKGQSVSTMRLDTDRGGTLSFKWRVDGYPYTDLEVFYYGDYLEVCVDGEQKGLISGTTDFQEVQLELSHDRHVVEWRYVKQMPQDYVGESVKDCGWVDEVKWVDFPPLSDDDISKALNLKTLQSGQAWLGFKNDGKQPWYLVEDAQQTADHAVHTPKPFGPNRKAVISTESVENAGTLSYDWLVEAGSKGCEWQLVVDGTIRARSSDGEAVGSTATIIGTGKHVVEFVFVSDEAGEGGGILDNVSFKPFKDDTSGSQTVDVVFHDEDGGEKGEHLEWTTGGSSRTSWFPQSVVVHDGPQAMQSGTAKVMSYNTWIATEFEGCGEFSFWWKVNCTSLDLYPTIGGQLSVVVSNTLDHTVEFTEAITGNLDWRKWRIPLKTGRHVVKFTYTHMNEVNPDDVEKLFNAGWVDSVKWLRDRAREKLEEAFEPNAIIKPILDEDGNPTNYEVTVTNNIVGPVRIPDDVGPVTVELDGHTITGPDGGDGTETSAGTNGAPAIVIYSDDDVDGEPTELTIVDNKKKDEYPEVKGGDGGDGNPAGDGAPAILVEDGADPDVVINIGPDVDVVGGNGGNGLGEDANGGDGGAGIEGDVGENEGTITGGDGGDGGENGGAGGDGGSAVDGDGPKSGEGKTDDGGSGKGGDIPVGPGDVDHNSVRFIEIEEDEASNEVRMKVELKLKSLEPGTADKTALDTFASWVKRSAKVECFKLKNAEEFADYSRTTTILTEDSVEADADMWAKSKPVIKIKVKRERTSNSHFYRFVIDKPAGK